MGLRSTAGTFRAFPSLGRRTFFSEQRLDRTEERLDVLERMFDDVRRQLADVAATAAINAQRLGTLEHQLEQLRGSIDAVDPQLTYDIACTVQDQMEQLGTELTEQMNRTSDLLARLERPAVG